MRNKTGVYIHIPFCLSKCLYCDFLSFPETYKHEFILYKNALINEIKNCEYLDALDIETIFFGGGTPTVFPPEYIYEILNELFKHNTISDMEITVEANPETLSKNNLSILRSTGVNRLSIGLQAWQNDLLKRLGRIHTVETFVEGYHRAMDLEFDNINIDLMFSLPGQKMNDWEQTLTRTAELKPSHISAYSLIVEENTPFHKMLEDGRISLPDDEADREMYYYLIGFLSDRGYEQYEISNFAKPDKECKHNKIYWERGNYLGFGLNSHSYYGGVRFNNTSDLNKYIQCYLYGKDTAVEDIIILSPKDEMEEFMFLGLRLTEGINPAKFNQYFGINIYDVYGNIINKQISEGLLEILKDKTDTDMLRLTRRGIDISNVVFARYIL